MTDALVLVANTRLPSERAQALQVVQSASAFTRAGLPTTLLYARRRPAIELPPGTDLFAHYQVGSGPRPELVEVDCADWIERVPRALQFWPARLQELTFSRNAAGVVRERHAGAWVLSREIECARELLRDERQHVFLELHRVPSGATRRAWLREAAARASGVVAISGGVRADLLELGVTAESIVVEHDAFESSRFERLPARSDARAALGLGSDQHVVVYTGGLLEWKGVDVLLGAARELPQATFLVVGGMQSDVAVLRAKAASLDNVRVEGLQPPAVVARYLVAADLGLVPNRSKPEISARHTSPLKVFEAMAVGLPLVASDLPSLRDVLTHDQDAWLVAPDDPRELARGIRRVLEDDALRRRLSEAFRSRAADHTWDARARRLTAWMRARA